MNAAMIDLVDCDARAIPPDVRVLLVDNGSLEPASTLQLRRIAARLRARLGVRVEPVSLAHSDRVAASSLDGTPAELFGAGLDRVLVEGAANVVTVPFFFGPNHAITRHVPAMLAERSRRFPTAEIALARALHQPGDERLAIAVAELVRAELRELDGGDAPRVVIVDHGSPSAAVTAVRDTVTEQVRRLIGGDVRIVSPASMERRPGAEFDFNEPTLAGLLSRPDWNAGPLVVGLLFLAPGRHAGPAGDVATIVTRARAGSMDAVRFAPTLGEHPLLLDVLVDRVLQAIAAPVGS